MKQEKNSKWRLWYLKRSTKVVVDSVSWVKIFEHFDGFHNEVKLNFVPNKINVLSWMFYSHLFQNVQRKKWTYTSERP